MFKSRVRRYAVAAFTTLGLTGAVVLPVSSANAATTYYEWESVKSQFDLVMTARSAVNGAKVGIATDNDTAHQQWSADHHGDGYWSYKLRASAHLSKPLCLDVEGDSQAQGAAIVVRECDLSPSQDWFGGNGGLFTDRLKNRWSGKYIQHPAGPEFLVNLIQTSLNSDQGLFWTWSSVVH